MCGILGKISWTENRDNFSLNSDLIKNRGPDSTDSYHRNNLKLIHTRLGIINKEKQSNQPLINDNLVLICNGEILNYKQLKKFIKFDYKTNSDCEVISAVYNKFGIKGFRLLKGFFSFVLADFNDNKIFLVKDSIGKKPLFYFNSNKEFIFSSNLDSIVNNSYSKFTLNLEQKSFFFKNGFIDPKKTILNEIHSCQPGDIIEVSLNQNQLHKKKIVHPERYKYFNFSSKKNIEKKILSLLTLSIKRRIDDLKNPILLFSSGIDSTILAIISKNINKTLKLVTVKNNFLKGEGKYVKQFEIKNKIKLKKINIFKFLNFSTVNNHILNLDQPFAAPSYIFLCFFSDIVKNFSNIVITGDGADEVFYGYEKFSKVSSNFSDKKNLNKTSFLNINHNFELNSLGKNIYDTGLAGHGFIKLDKSFSENQIECRAPFLDYDLIYFIRQIPISYWKDSSENKSFLKKFLLSNGFNREYIYRKKKGIVFPFKYFLLINYFRILIYNLINKKKYGFKVKFFDINYLWKLYVFNKFLNKNNGKVFL